jgi:hypothetical protein
MQNGRMLTIATLDGSPPMAVTDSLVSVAGISWSGNDTLILDGRGASPFVRVAASAHARPELLTALDSSFAELDQYYPEVLPGGDVLYQMNRQGSPTAIAVLDPLSGARQVIVEAGRRPRYAAGYLLYITHDGMLMAAPFDYKRKVVTSVAIVVGTGLATTPLGADFAVSESGTLVFIASTEGSTENELVWASRQGNVAQLDSSWRGQLAEPALSPDGTSLAVTVGSSSGNSDVWTRSLRSNVPLRVSMQEGRNRSPYWTRDGKFLLYASSGSTHAIIENLTDGTLAPKRRVQSRRAIDEITATPDGEWVVFSEGGFSNPRLYAHRRGDSAATRLFNEETPQRQPALSPDGRFLAFTIFDGQLSKAYVSPFPNHGGMKWQVSPKPAWSPVWSNSGRELFFRDLVAGTLVAVPVTSENSFSVGVPKVLFAAPGDARYTVSGDDSRFLMVRPAGTGAVSRPRLTMIENWVGALAQTKRP